MDPLTSQLTITTTAVPQDGQGHPDRHPRDQRRDRPARIHVQPDQLRTDVLLGHRLQHRRRHGTTGKPLPDGLLQGTDLPARTGGLNAGEGLQDRRDEPERARSSTRPGTWVPTRPARSRTSKRQDRTAKAAALAPDDLAEGMHGRDIRSQPGQLSAASMVGHATAITPVLPVPLTGPVYFVSNGGEAFPELSSWSPRLRRDSRSARQNVHQQGRDHELELPSSPRRPDRLLRTRTPLRPLLRTDRQRQPLHLKPADADRIRRPKRRCARAVDKGQRHRVLCGRRRRPATTKSTRPKNTKKHHKAKKDKKKG